MIVWVKHVDTGKIEIRETYFTEASLGAPITCKSMKLTSRSSLLELPSNVRQFNEWH